MTASLNFNQRLLAILQLMRLANVFTAIADVWMGFAIAMGSLQPTLLMVGLTVCSALLYTAGMVLNDAMDAGIDATERPSRPIPSGRVSLRFAHFLGWNMLLVGMFVGFAMSFLCNSMAPGLIAWVLSVTIVAYNSSLKKTWLGPAVLGACRGANVLLGMSPLIIQFGVLDFLLLDIPISPALGLACYICGIGVIARQEHKTSRRAPLLFGAALIACGFATFATAPWWELAASSLVISSWQWLSLWSLLGCSMLYRLITTILAPVPKNVQRAVGYGILLIIPIDATLCAGYVGWECAAIVLALLVPAKMLSRWIYVT